MFSYLIQFRKATVKYIEHCSKEQKISYESCSTKKKLFNLKGYLRVVSQIEMQTCPSCNELVPVEYVTCVWCGYDLTAEHIRRSGIKINWRDAFRRGRNMFQEPRLTTQEIVLVPDVVGGRFAIYFISLAFTLHMLIMLYKFDGISYTKVNFAYGTNVLTNILIFFISLLPIIVFLLLWPILFTVVFTVVWKVAARLLNTLNRSLGGQNEPIKVRSILGYSLVPVLVALVITLPLRLFSPSYSPSSEVYNQFSQGIQNMTNSPIGIIIKLLIGVGWLLGASFAVYGNSKAAKLSIFESFITVGIPYLIFLYFILL